MNIFLYCTKQFNCNMSPIICSLNCNPKFNGHFYALNSLILWFVLESHLKDSLCYSAKLLYRMSNDK